MKNTSGVSAKYASELHWQRGWHTARAAVMRELADQLEDLAGDARRLAAVAARHVDMYTDHIVDTCNWCEGWEEAERRGFNAWGHSLEHDMWTVDTDNVIHTVCDRRNALLDFAEGVVT